MALTNASPIPEAKADPQIVLVPGLVHPAAVSWSHVVHSPLIAPHGPVLVPHHPLVVPGVITPPEVIQINAWGKQRFWIIINEICDRINWKMCTSNVYTSSFYTFSAAFSKLFSSFRYQCTFTILCWCSLKTLLSPSCHWPCFVKIRIRESNQNYLLPFFRRFF